MDISIGLEPRCEQDRVNSATAVWKQEKSTAIAAQNTKNGVQHSLSQKVELKHNIMLKHI